MRIRDMNWRQVEAWLEHDDRAVLPLGSTEQHAGLSLAVDAILSEKVAADAAEPSRVPVFPAVSYGLTPYFLCRQGCARSSSEGLYSRDVGVKRRELWVDD